MSTDKYFQRGVGYRNLLISDVTVALKTPEQLCKDWQAEQPVGFKYACSLKQVEIIDRKDEPAFKKAVDEMPSVLMRFESLKKLEAKVQNENLRASQLLKAESHDVYAAMYSMVTGLDFEFLSQFSSSQIKEVVRLMRVYKFRDGEYIVKPTDPSASKPLQSIVKPSDHICMVFYGKVGIYDHEGMPPVSSVKVGDSFGSLKDIINNISPSQSLRCTETTVIGVVDASALNKAVRQQKLLDENRITDFFTSHTPFSLIPFHRAWRVLPCLRHQHIRLNKPLFQSTNSIPAAFIVLRGAVRIHATVTFNGYLDGHVPTSTDFNPNIGLRVFENVPLMEVRAGQMFGLTETGFTSQWRIAAKNVAITDMKVKPIEEGKLVSLTKEGLSEVLANMAELNMALFHVSRELKRLEEETISQLLLILDKDDFDMKSAQFIQATLLTAKMHACRYDDLPILKELDDFGKQLQVRELATAKAYHKFEQTKDHLHLDKLPDGKPYSWRQSPAIHNKLPGECYYRPTR